MPKRSSKEADRRRRLFGAILLGAMATFRAAASALVESLAEGSITGDTFVNGYIDVLTTLHTKAAYAGRGVASTLNEIPMPQEGYSDDVFGVAQASGQSTFVRGFRDAIERGDYADPEKAGPRIDLYTNRSIGTANEAMVASLDDDPSGAGYIEWVLAPGAEEAHCEDCPRWAAEGPYTRHSLPAVPGDGKSRCKTNCLCSLRVYGIDVTMLKRP